ARCRRRSPGPTGRSRPPRKVGCGGEGAGLTEGPSTVQQIRGSSVLLVGRVLAMLLSGLTQVVIVRHLSKLDYGAFAYALSIAMFAHRLVSVGHGLCTTRFLSIYDERREYDKVFGTIAMVLGTVTAAGLVLLGALAVFRNPLSRW